MSVRWETAFVQGYGRLVRAAYVLDAGHRSRQARWWRAHQLVHRALPWRAGRQIAADAEDGYQVMLARVLNRALSRRWSWPGAFSRLARAATPPGGPEHAAVDAALASAEPQARAAYLLLMAEGMNRKSATAVLTIAGAPDPYSAVSAALKIRDGLAHDHGLDAARQAELLDEPAMNPTVARIQAPAPALLRTARLGRGLAGGAAAAVLIAGAVVLTTGAASTPQKQQPAEKPAGGVRLVGGTAWQGSAYPVLASWPSRGESQQDKQLTGAAVTAWRDKKNVQVGRGTDGAPPVGTPQLLFAGKVDGVPVVLLADKSRLARYTEGKGLELSPMPAATVAGASALRLAGTRYLLAPWVKQAQTGVLGGAWQDLPAKDGVTDPVRPVAGSCYTGPLLRLTLADVGQNAPVSLADLGQIGLVHLTQGEPGAPRALDAPGGVWDKLGCQLTEWQETAVVAVHAWEFWSGQLPAGGGAGRWACLRGDLADGSNQARAVLTGGTGVHSTAVVRGSRVCSSLGGPVAATTWWKAPAGTWHVLAAASPGTEKIEVTVGTAKPGAAKTYVTAGPFPDQNRPVTVKATAGGKELPVLGVIGG
ncbi:hypothetical protein [Longispora albida]|uniref:hypothetical protein n=1 Tax=Longispora albida TaxID=203523 RepID=UPI00036C4778|nr:hypothetical protein [Longispora albida]